MLKGVPDSLERALWPHQRHALGVVRRYLSAWQKGLRRSSLIQMPTGTGKTAVIATAAHYLAGPGVVLVVAPRIALRDQLHKELAGGVFQKLQVAGPAIRPVRRLDDAAAAPGIGADDIIVTTIQLLASVTDDASWRSLLGRVSMVVFDEGHYEPARTWSDAVRAIDKPRVIVSATPFRDDLKLFDVDSAHTYRYALRDAVAAKYVRSLKFNRRPSTTKLSEFVMDVVKEYDRLFDSKVAREAARAIIRCETPEEIRQVAAALRAQGRSCVAIHHTFDTAAGSEERRQVPDPQATPEIFWVHQNKLLEGIDDHRFQLLAVYGGLQSVRSFVQQAGRIIRNPGGKAGQAGVVLDYSGGRYEALWKNYLRYDECVAKEESVEVNGAELVRALKQAVPGILYANGRFRSAMELDSISVEDLVLPFTVRAFLKPEHYSHARVRADIAAACSDADLLWRELPVKDPLSVFVHVRIGASSVLRNGYFPEPALGVTVVFEAAQHVFLYESGASVVASLLESKPPRRSDLHKLFSTGGDARLTSVSLANSNIGAEQVRSRSVAAAKIDSLAPAFDEHGYLLSTATGYSTRIRENPDKSVVRRYVGATNGRITDYESERVSVDEWLTWVQAVEKRLLSKVKPPTVFRRWATDAEPPPPDKGEAVNILLDVEDVRGLFETIGDEEVPPGLELELEDACVPVKGGIFSVVASGRTHHGRVAFDASRNRYRISCPTLDAAYQSKDKSETGVVAFLNRSQSFRVIPEAPTYLYALGSFCRPQIRFGADSGDQLAALLGSLIPTDAMVKAKSEKGSSCKGNGSGWEDGCLFNSIDQGFAGTDLEKWFVNVDVLVCDDLGFESADFVMVNRPYGDDRRRVTFIHAKASAKPAKWSASALQVVCAQAQKNLREVSLFNDDVDTKAEKWSGRWSDGRVKGTVKTRVRPLGQVRSADAAWKEIRRTVRDASAEREVWIMVGNQLSRAAVEKQWRKEPPLAETIQLAYLLLSTVSNTAAAGARLRVFCSP